MKIISKSLPLKAFDTIDAQLTFNEVRTLEGILSRVGGNPEKSRRKYVNDILAALQEHTGSPFGETTSDISGHIAFIKDEWEFETWQDKRKNKLRHNVDSIV